MADDPVLKYLKPERLEDTSEKAWKHWKKTFENFLSKTKVTEEADKLLLLTNHVTSEVFEHISDAADYTSAIKTLSELFVRPNNVIFNRHLLATSKQGEAESLEQFLQKLRTVSKDCEFKTVTALVHQEESVRDAFISGLRSASIRQRLLEQSDLNLDEAYKTARSLDAAQKNSEQYGQSAVYSAAISDHPASNSNQNDSENSLAYARPYNNQFKSKDCTFCGKGQHHRSKCPASNTTCSNCLRRGHFPSVCRSKPQSQYCSQPQQYQPQQYQPQQYQHRSSAAVTTQSITYAPTLASIRNKSESKVYIPVKVNGIATTALIDTGSTDSYVNKNFIETHGIASQPRDPITVKLANSSESQVVSQACTLSVSITNEIGTRDYPSTSLSVMPYLIADVVLGEDFMKQHDSILIQYGGTKPQLTLCSLGTMRNIQPPELFKYLKPECAPVATKTRNFSRDDAVFIQNTVRELLENGIIEPSKSPWRSQVLITKNPNHKKRMVVDYSQTINRFTYLDAFPLPTTHSTVSKVAQYSVFSSLDLKSAYHQIKLSEQDRIYTAFEACGKLYQMCCMPFGPTNAVPCFQRIMTQIIEDNECEGVFGYSDNVTVCGHDKVEHDRNLKKFLEVAKSYNITFNDSKSVIAAESLQLLGYEVRNGTLKPDKDRVKALMDMSPPKNDKELKRILGLFSYYAQWIPKYSEVAKPLINTSSFPWSTAAQSGFDLLKEILSTAVLHSINMDIPFKCETDASDTTLAATLTQNERPVAFWARTLLSHESNYPSIEKEALAIVEALAKWSDLLMSSPMPFTLVTDQRSVSFMFDNHRASKIKNDKILRWRLELSPFQYQIVYRPGKLNIPADTLSRACPITSCSLLKLHEDLCHPGIARFYHFVKTKNLPYSMEDVKKMTASCEACAKLKPQFYKPNNPPLIKATHPFERLNIDFKGPLPSTSRNKYFLTIVDEYSRFPFVYPCQDVSTTTVIKCLNDMFSIFGMSGYIHSDRGSSFMSQELKQYLHSKGIATSRTTSFNPEGNGQCERYNGIVWKAIQLSLFTKGEHISHWETAIPDALHSIRSLLSTATNSTPHERMFKYNRKSSNGLSVPSWLTNSQTVLLKRRVRQSKHDPLVDEVKLLDVNPCYARVEFANGRVDTVSLKHLAPPPLATDIVEPPLHATPFQQSTPPHHVVSTPHQPALPCQPAPPHHVVSSPEPLELLVSEPEVSESKAPTRTSSRRTERIDYKALNDGKGTVFKKDI